MSGVEWKGILSRREKLRRAVEDGERLYRKRMHDEPTIADDNRIDGILTLDLVDALGLVDELLSLAGLDKAALEARWREHLDAADENDEFGGHVGISRYHREAARAIGEKIRGV